MNICDVNDAVPCTVLVNFAECRDVQLQVNFKKFWSNRQNNGCSAVLCGVSYGYNFLAVVWCSVAYQRYMQSTDTKFCVRDITDLQNDRQIKLINSLKINALNLYIFTFLVPK